MQSYVVGNRLFADVVVKVRSYWVRMGPKSSMTDNPIRRGKFGHRDEDTQGEWHARMEAEVGVMLPQAKDTKDCWQP